MKFIARVILPLALLSYIAYETWLKFHHQSLCSATGCRLAGELLRFPDIYLNYMGLGAVGAILLFGLLSLFSRAFEKLYFITLYAAIAFESIMIGYQIFVNPEPCIFCLGVYGGLLLIALASRPAWLVYALPAILAIFFALGDLAIPRNEALIKGDGLYLVASDHCPHCKKVKEFFAQKKIDYRLLPVSDPSVRHLAKALGIGEIPILIRRKGGETTILYGDRPIIASFNKENVAPATEPLPSPAGSFNPYAGPEQEGCSLSPLPGNGGCEESGPEIPLR
ncbi:glutaredoxin family protein [Nitratifractor sp.]